MQNMASLIGSPNRVALPDYPLLKSAKGETMDLYKDADLKTKHSQSNDRRNRCQLGQVGPGAQHNCASC